MSMSWYEIKRRINYLTYHPWWARYVVVIAHPDLRGGFKNWYCVTKRGAMNVAAAFAENPHWKRVTVGGRPHPFGPFKECIYNSGWRGV